MAAKGKRKARIARRVVAYALLGLVTTLGIAWSAPPVDEWALLFEWRGAALPGWLDVPAGTPVQVQRRDEWGETWYQRIVIVPDAGIDTTPPPPADPAGLAADLRGLRYVEIGMDDCQYPSGWYPLDWNASYCGFPFRCVWGWDAPSRLPGFPGRRAHSFLNLAPLVGGPGKRSLMFPVIPVWPGLLADTTIWGLAWYALLFVPLRLLPWSAASRRRRGLCVECGYDLTGARVRCPECGAELVAAMVPRV